MAYYEDEILRELEVGETYTSRQIEIFIYENPNVVILADDSRISDSNDIKYTVRNKIEKYIHQQSKTSYRTYLIPNSTSSVYELERL